MATYYVGPGGSNGNSGTSWPNRKLTLNGAEDIPVTAGDTVYVGPGVYRETLTCDVSGSSGSPITYVGDVTGANTDGVGGTVRITGSNDDATETRGECLNVGNKNYRTFRGFLMDGAQYDTVYCTDIDGVTIEDCVIQHTPIGYSNAISSDDTDNLTIRRCIIFCGIGKFLSVSPSSAYAGTSNLVENCLIIGSEMWGDAILINQCDGFTLRNLTMICPYSAIKVTALDTNGYSLTAQNNIIYSANYGFVADATGGIVEDYNALIAVDSPRTNTATGANSTTGLYLFESPTLSSGVQMPTAPWFAPSPWAPWAREAGSSPPGTDLLGLPRPSTNSKASWGAMQRQDIERETGTTYDSSAASLKLADAGVHQMYVPVDGTEITVSVRAYREANYAGTAPRMVIRQPGQSDRTTTDAGSASTWNELTDTFTPASSPPYVVVDMQSLNTATSGSYAAYFDSLSVA